MKAIGSTLFHTTLRLSSDHRHARTGGRPHLTIYAQKCLCSRLCFGSWAGMHACWSHMLVRNNIQYTRRSTDRWRSVMAGRLSSVNTVSAGRAVRATLKLTTSINPITNQANGALPRVGDFSLTGSIHLHGGLLRAFHGSTLLGFLSLCVVEVRDPVFLEPVQIEWPTCAKLFEAKSQRQWLEVRLSCRSDLVSFLCPFSACEKIALDISKEGENSMLGKEPGILSKSHYSWRLAS